jgi:hypothetical protein
VKKGALCSSGCSRLTQTTPYSAEKRRADVRKAEALLVADAYTITKGHRPVVTVLHNQVGPEGEPLGDWQITIMPLDA